MSAEYKCLVNIYVDRNGNQKLIEDVIIDTGFAGSAGLKLPMSFASTKEKETLPTSIIEIGNGKTIPVFVDANKTRILTIDGKPITDRNPIPTIFMDGQAVIGIEYLKRCWFVLSGPQHTGYLRFL